MIYTDPDTVARVQILLKEKGYVELSEIDGNLGEMTRDTILAFRRRNRLPLTDQIDDDLLRFLPSAPNKELPQRVTTATEAHLESRVSAVATTAEAKKSSWWAQFWGWFLTVPSGAFTILTLMLSNVQQAIDTVQPIKNFLVDLPVWIWGLGLFLVALVLAINARRTQALTEQTQQQLISGYRDGTIKNDKDV
jgi:peptidoglycan hydrolase-like protein with peptidoglycan-binding domain